MIIVSVRLVSAISHTRDRELARMEICNIGGTDDLGDYEARTLRGRDLAALDQRRTQRTGFVRDHPRLREHVWNLVAKALKELHYGKVDTKTTDRLRAVPQRGGPSRGRDGGE